MRSFSYTRGNGLLEPALAKLRAQRANRLIPQRLRNGRILDIGCGSYPYFLSHTSFKEKFALEQHPPPPAALNGIEWYILDLNAGNHLGLPFRECYFNVVTLLAVIEHLNPNNLVALFKEIYRILAPGGIVILTTPAAWSDGLLKVMSKIGMVSKEEIDEHVYTYTLPLIGWYFGKAGFEMEKVKFGYFESMLNMWATAER